MEKEQHKSKRSNQEQSQDQTNGAPGQQLPANNEISKASPAPAEEERHSESSLPKRDNETLGTP